MNILLIYIILSTAQRESIEANLEKSQEDLEKLPEVTSTDDNRELDKNEPESPANAEGSEEEGEDFSFNFKL
jgi:hypothetical protein